MSSTELPLEDLANLTPEAQRELLKQLLQERSDSARRFPMSSQQQGLWYAYRRDPTATSFSVYGPSRIRSKLDIDAMRKTIEHLVERHPGLRTTFTDHGLQLTQTVHDSLPPTFEVFDVKHLSEHEIRSRAMAEIQRPFDLENGPMLRVAVFVKAPDDCIVVPVTHHIVVDFWSMIIVLRDLQQAYPSFLKGVQPDLPPVDGNYHEFVKAQKDYVAGEQGAKSWEYWKETLKDLPRVLELPADYHRPTNFIGRASVAPIPFAEGTAAKMARVARAAKTTPSAVLMAALQVLVHRYTDQKSFMIGTPFSGRSHQKYEQTIGYFANVLPLPADLGGNPTFTALSERVGRTLVDTLEQENYPFSEIVHRARPDRDSSRSPIFQVACFFEQSHIRDVGNRALLLPGQKVLTDFGGLALESYCIPLQTCNFDIEFFFEQTDSEVLGEICYCKELFTAATAAEMSRNFVSLLNGLLDNADQPIDAVPWTRSGEIEALEYNQPPETLTALVNHRNDDMALVQDDLRFTHNELQTRSDRIAANLRTRGIGRGDLVPVVAARGAIATIGMLGVMKSGAAVIPLDRTRPAVNCANLIADADPLLVVVDEACSWCDGSNIDVATIDELCSATDDECNASLTEEIAPEDLAYVLYTSGSTGQPNGVMVQHAAIANLIRWRERIDMLVDMDRVLMLLSHQFDAGFGLAFSSLAQGASVVWAKSGAASNIDKLMDQIISERITVLETFPSMMRLIVSHPRFSECYQLRAVYTGAERMPTEIPELVRRHTLGRVFNFYGPTEATVISVAHEIKNLDPREPIPIGEPILNMDGLVLDPELRPVPDTVPGQLALRGRGLAQGYLNRPELTEEKFVKLDGVDDIVYLTGDRVRRRADGTLDFLGRIDSQVKVLGHRIELDEVESVLRDHRFVRNVAVTVFDPESDGARLAAFVLPDVEEPPATIIAALKAYAAEHLPSYKRPMAWGVIDELPRTPNGKIDRRQLPDSVPDEFGDEKPIAPATPLEEYVADIWADLLDLDDVPANRNFFQLGGNSLRAIIMATKISDELNIEQPAVLLFNLDDVTTLSRRIVQMKEVEIVTRFGAESVTAYASCAALSAMPEDSPHPLLANYKETGSRPPVFMVHPPGGIVICYRELANQVHEDQPFYAIRARGLHGKEALPSTIEEMAADYIEVIKSVRPQGPYVIGGWSLGGLAAYEICRQLRKAGDDVQKLILLDTTIPEGASDLVDKVDRADVGLEYGLDFSLEELSQLEEGEQLPLLLEHAKNQGMFEGDKVPPQEVIERVLEDLKELFHLHVQVANSYRVEPLDVKTLYVRPQHVPLIIASEDRGWKKLVRDIEVIFVPGNHYSIVQMPHVTELAKLF